MSPDVEAALVTPTVRLLIDCRPCASAVTMSVVQTCAYVVLGLKHPHRLVKRLTLDIIKERYCGPRNDARHAVVRATLLMSCRGASFSRWCAQP